VPPAPTRSRDDETGQLLVECGQVLVRTGTPIEQLTLADAAKFASRRTKRKITTGSAYPRFHGQDKFRLAVLEAFLFDGPRYSDIALNGIMRAIHELEDAKSDSLEPLDIEALVEKVAAEHEDVIRSDSELPLRLYAIWRLTRLEKEGSEHAKQQMAKVREREHLENEEWGRIVGKLAEQLGAAPLKDVNIRDLEYGLTALRTGLLARQETTGIPDGILERLTVCLILGFFAKASEAEKATLPERFTSFLRSLSPQSEPPEVITQTLVDESAKSLRRLSPITDEDIEEADSPALERAMNALRNAGKGI
jgi:hypothetical protein